LPCQTTVGSLAAGVLGSAEGAVGLQQLVRVVVDTAVVRREFHSCTAAVGIVSIQAVAVDTVRVGTAQVGTELPGTALLGIVLLDTVAAVVARSTVAPF